MKRSFETIRFYVDFFILIFCYFFALIALRSSYELVKNVKLIFCAQSINIRRQSINRRSPQTWLLGAPFEKYAFVSSNHKENVKINWEKKTTKRWEKVKVIRLSIESFLHIRLYLIKVHYMRFLQDADKSNCYLFYSSQHSIYSFHVICIRIWLKCTLNSRMKTTSVNHICYYSLIHAIFDPKINHL